MNIYNDNNNNSVTILSQLDQTGVWRGGGGGEGSRGGGGQEGFPKPVSMLKVVAFCQTVGC